MNKLKLQKIQMESIDICKWIHPDVYLSYSKIPNADLGVFAKNNIVAGTCLGEYLGEIIPKNELNPCDNYFFEYNNTHHLTAIDINKSNYTRYLNCSYSYESENVIGINMTNDYLYNCSKNLKNRKFFFAKRLIQKNEEMLFYYGDNYAHKLNINYRNNICIEELENIFT
jgi:SET domain-containing protein